MHHKLLTQRALFCIGVDAKKGTLSQHFMMHVTPPMVWTKSPCCGVDNYGVKSSPCCCVNHYGVWG